MSVYFRFKSSTVVESIPIDGPFIPVSYLKGKIIERKKIGKGNDLVVINPKTNEEYVDEETLIHKCSTVLIRRVPRRYLLPIVLAPVSEPEDRKEEEGLSVQTLNSKEDSSTIVNPEDSEWDEFVAKNLNSNSVDSESQSKSGSRVSNSDENSNGGRSTSVAVVHSFNRRVAPPPGYVCHRCNIPGHFIQHCSTNGDPNFDVKRLKRPIGIPTSMLVPSRDGSYALPTGDSADIKPNEAVFEKEIEGVPIRNSVVDLPPELKCPLCKNPMKDAVFTRCCFRSFCDSCIRDHIITKSMCDCGATGVLADDLLPNPTLRATINRMLWSDHSSSSSSGRSSSSNSNKSGVESNTSQIQKTSVQQSSLSHSCGGGSSSTLRKEETCQVPETVENLIGSVAKVANVSETMNNEFVVSVNEKEIEQNVSLSRSKKNNDVKKQNRFDQNCSISNSNNNYMVSNGYGPGPYAYNPPYWNTYTSFNANNFHPYMSYGVAPMMNVAGAEKFETRKPNMKRKREIERYRGY